MAGANEKSAEKLGKLVETLRGRRSLLIVMQDNPDPDSFAAAAALRRLAHHADPDLACSIAYGGVVGRGENRALVSYLGLNFRRIGQVEPSKFDVVALVDTQPGSGNNSLPAEVRADVVLDHHPLRPETRSAPFTDVRRRYGAVSTILWEYLVAARIEPDPPLATALLYAIRTDTRDLGTEAAGADVAAAEGLFRLANTRMLSAIQRGSVNGEYFATLSRALDVARVHGETIIALLGDVPSPDSTGEIADLFLRHEDVEWVLCLGYHDAKAWISVRTARTGEPAGALMRDVMHGIGTGGGHDTLAGGQVVLERDSAAERERIEREIRSRFLDAMGQSPRGGRRLVPNGPV